jgi:predicted metal-dependent hydrolase
MIEYVHKVNARSRSLKLSIDKKGTVIVTTPRFIPQFAIRKFVDSHRDWIETQLKKLQSIKKKLDVDKNQVLLFGKAYKLIANIDRSVPIGVRKIGEELHINPVQQTEASIQSTLERFLKSAGSQYILKVTEVMAKKMQTSYANVSFKTQKTRWGSCSSKGNLNFNWRLVHTPPEIVNYVIIHELAHRTHMDHSTNFWKLVEKFDPEYRKHRGWLKRHGMAIND